MKKIYLAPAAILLLWLLPFFSNAQSTYAQVYQILHTSCTGSSCHDGSSPIFNATVSPDSLYRALINKTPVNPSAGTAYNKLIVPGDVQHSFLLRKIAHRISDGLALNQPAEGLDMPNGLPALANNQIELIRQWILNAAPDTGTVVDTSIINTFYRVGGITDVYSPHNAPAPGTGFQIYIGSIFIPANTEVEWFCKYDPHITTSIEVPHYATMLASTTHHFILYNFQMGADVLYRPGLRPISESSMNSVTTGIGGFGGDLNLQLPPGTAFYYGQGQQMDADLHIINPSTDSILRTDIYVNLFTQPVGTAAHYMTLTIWSNDTISIPEDNQPHMLENVGNDSTQTQYYTIWKIYSHTHKYGTGFDIWLRNPDGTKGAQVYDGNYSYEDGYDVGYYRWGPHSTTHTYPDDSMLIVDPRLGFIWDATFTNTAGPNPVQYGPTSADEMDIMGFVGYSGANLPTSIMPVSTDKITTKVYPNPTLDEFSITYELAQSGNVSVDLMDVTGKKLASLINNNTSPAGKYSHTFNTNDYRLAAGIYYVSFNIGNSTATQKLIVTE